jgi:hypothetical protein
MMIESCTNNIPALQTPIFSVVAMDDNKHASSGIHPYKSIVVGTPVSLLLGTTPPSTTVANAQEQSHEPDSSPQLQSYDSYDSKRRFVHQKDFFKEVQAHSTLKELNRTQLMLLSKHTGRQVLQFELVRQ